MRWENSLILGLMVLTHVTNGMIFAYFRAIDVRYPLHERRILELLIVGFFVCSWRLLLLIRCNLSLQCMLIWSSYWLVGLLLRRRRLVRFLLCSAIRVVPIANSGPRRQNVVPKMSSLFPKLFVVDNFGRSLLIKGLLLRYWGQLFLLLSAGWCIAANPPFLLAFWANRGWAKLCSILTRLSLHLLFINTTPLLHHRIWLIVLFTLPIGRLRIANSINIDRLLYLLVQDDNFWVTTLWKVVLRNHRLIDRGMSTIKVYLLLMLIAITWFIILFRVCHFCWNLLTCQAVKRILVLFNVSLSLCCPIIVIFSCLPLQWPVSLIGIVFGAQCAARGGSTWGLPNANLLDWTLPRLLARLLIVIVLVSHSSHLSLS